MGAYKYIKENFQKQYKNRDSILKKRVSEWGKESSIVRLEKPTNIARARELGYKAKQGVVVVRCSIRKGMRKREKPRGGRKPSKNGRFFSYVKSLQSIAEERASRKYMNTEVLNSYYVGEDGRYKFFEVILLDGSHGSILSDSLYSDVVSSKGRVFRGLTSSGIKHRGLLHKGKTTIISRPSVRSAQRGIRV
ncbi:MAG: 50S ribosomal protein L15e [Candidatus Micrarchaeia archaeon]